jgi:glycerophosphoryl diester phosphodiesterase
MLKIFAHRGFVGNCDQQNYIKQNSLASLKNAYDSGFRAIEFDIWFCNSQLILAHDQPQLDDYKNLAHFSDFLIYGNELDYWLDFKNLDESNANKALELVKLQIDSAKINLEQIFFAPYCTDYNLSKKLFDKFSTIFGSSISFVAILDDQKQIPQLLDFIKENNIKFISAYHNLINYDLLQKFNGVEFLAWTVNETPILENLAKIGVKYFASDNCLDKITIDKIVNSKLIKT